MLTKFERNRNEPEERIDTTDKNLNRVIKIDEAQIHSHLDEMVRDTVKETINKMLDAEADRLCNAQ
jgi:chemotaxis protein CheY-P-specific phosphatase CheC